MKLPNSIHSLESVRRPGGGEEEEEGEKQTLGTFYYWDDYERHTQSKELRKETLFYQTIESIRSYVSDAFLSQDSTHIHTHCCCFLPLFWCLFLFLSFSSSAKCQQQQHEELNRTVCDCCWRVNAFSYWKKKKKKKKGEREEDGIHFIDWAEPSITFTSSPFFYRHTIKRRTRRRRKWLHRIASSPFSIDEKSIKTNINSSFKKGAFSRHRRRRLVFQNEKKKRAWRN